VLYVPLPKIATPPVGEQIKPQDVAPESIQGDGELPPIR
jgi:hypothetical protein